jgi:hypothetical protein
MPREAGRHVACKGHPRQIGLSRLAPVMQVNVVCMTCKQRSRMATVHTGIGCLWQRMIELFAKRWLPY